MLHPIRGDLSSMDERITSSVHFYGRVTNYREV